MHRSSPPNTPQWHHDAEHQQEHESHIMNTSQHCWVPQYNSTPVPGRNNDDDSFLDDININGQQLCLSQGIWQQLAALPLLQPSPQPGRCWNAVAGPSHQEVHDAIDAVNTVWRIQIFCQKTWLKNITIFHQLFWQKIQIKNLNIFQPDLKWKMRWKMMLRLI